MKTLRSPSMTFRESRRDDNFGLIQLVQNCPMEGATRAYIDRHPDFFALPKLQGDEWHVFVSEVNGEVTGNFSYTFRQEMWGGEKVKVLHGGDLRIDPRRRNSNTLMTFVKFYRNLLRQPDYHHGMVEIMAGNESPLKCQELLKRAVDVVPAGNAFSYQLVPLFPCPPTTKFQYRVATHNDLNAIADLLRVCYRNHCGQPVFTASYLKNHLKQHPSFNIESLWLAEKNDRIVACMGFWDQHSIRRTVVTRFEWRTRSLLAGLKLLAPIVNLPAIPQINNELQFSYLRLLACYEGSIAALAGLIRLKLNAIRREKKQQFLMVSFHERDELKACLDGLIRNRTVAKLFHYFPKHLSQQERARGHSQIPYVDFSLV